MAFSDMVVTDPPLDCEIAAGFRGAVLQIVRVWRMELGVSIMCVSRPRVLSLAPEMAPPRRPLGRVGNPRQATCAGDRSSHTATAVMFTSSRCSSIWSGGMASIYGHQLGKYSTCSVRYSALGVQVVSGRP